jgi:hypothetical protein
MKKINLAVVPVLFLLPTLSWGFCLKGGTMISHNSGFGISTDENGSSSNSSDNLVVNVPLTIDGKEGCFKKKNSFSLQAEDTKKKSEGKVIIKPMSVDFKNVPQPHFKQYLFVEKASEISKVKFHTMAFVCSGSMPLSIEAHSDLYAKLMERRGDSTTVSFTIATGRAAEEINKRQAKNRPSHQATFDTFLQAYRDKTQKDLEDAPIRSGYAPSIFMSSTIDSLSALERKIAGGFTTMGAKVVNGCSSEFSEAMKSYQVENASSNPTLKSFKVGKKSFSGAIVIEWKN